MRTGCEQYFSFGLVDWLQDGEFGAGRIARDAMRCRQHELAMQNGEMRRRCVLMAEMLILKCFQLCL